MTDYNYQKATNNKTYPELSGIHGRGGRVCSTAGEESSRGGPCGVADSGGRREPRNVTGEGVTSFLINSFLRICSYDASSVRYALQIEASTCALF